MPNLEGRSRVETYETLRRGRLCRVPPLGERVLGRLRTSREQSFGVKAPKIFNVLSMDIRCWSGTLGGFKTRLDSFLSTVPDQPCMPQYYQVATSNSLLERIPRLRMETLSP